MRPSNGQPAWYRRAARSHHTLRVKEPSVCLTRGMSANGCAFTRSVFSGALDRMSWDATPGVLHRGSGGGFKTGPVCADELEHKLGLDDVNSSGTGSVVAPCRLLKSLAPLAFLGQGRYTVDIQRVLQPSWLVLACSNSWIRTIGRARGVVV